MVGRRVTSSAVSGGPELNCTVYTPAAWSSPEWTRPLAEERKPRPQPTGFPLLSANFPSLMAPRHLLAPSRSHLGLPLYPSLLWPGGLFGDKRKAVGAPAESRGRLAYHWRPRHHQSPAPRASESGKKRLFAEPQVFHSTSVCVGPGSAPAAAPASPANGDRGKSA